MPIELTETFSHKGTEYDRAVVEAVCWLYEISPSEAWRRAMKRWTNVRMTEYTAKTEPKQLTLEAINVLREMNFKGGDLQRQLGLRLGLKNVHDQDSAAARLDEMAILLERLQSGGMKAASKEGG